MNVQLTVQVPRSEDLDQNINRLENKLNHLLRAFRPDLVQLQGRLVRHTRREGVACRLNLHLPTAQLSSEKNEVTAQLALRAAGEDLLRQVQKHKARLRENRSQPQARVPREEAAAGTGPRMRPEEASNAAAARERRRADLAGYFGTHFEEVLGFVRRQIHLREQLGEIPAGSIEAAEVMNEVVVAALDEHPDSGPLSRGRWLLVLAAGAIRRLTKTYSPVQHGQQMLTLHSDPMALDEPDPEELASTGEMMTELAGVLRTLPPPERHDLVLARLEGFHPAELARLSHRTPEEVEISLRSAEANLRQRSDLPSNLRRHLRLDAPGTRHASRHAAAERLRA